MTTAACVSAISCPSVHQHTDLAPVTAFGGAIGLENPSRVLRDQVAEYILQHPDKYNKAILGEDPQRYTTRMKQMDTWGGAIELSILSDIYNLEISSIDVKVGFETRFLEPNAGKLTRSPVAPHRPLRRRQVQPSHHPLLGHPLRQNSLLHGPELPRRGGRDSVVDR